MAKRLMKFIPPSHTHRMGAGSPARRRVRLEQRTRMAHLQVAGMIPFLEAKEELFNALSGTREKPSNVAIKIIKKNKELTPEAREKLLKGAKGLNTSWAIVRSCEKEAVKDPPRFFERVFGVKPADGGIKVSCTSCDIHLAISPANREVLARKGFLDSDHEGIYFSEDSEFSRLKLKDTVSLSLLENGDVEASTRDHEKRHHFQEIFSMRLKKSHSSIVRDTELSLRDEMAAYARTGKDPLFPENVEYYLKRATEGDLRIYAKRIARDRENLAKAGAMPKNREIEWIIKKLNSDIAKNEGYIEMTRIASANIEKTVMSKAFRKLMQEAQKVVPDAILASFIENTSLKRIETLLPELVDRYRKKIRVTPKVKHQK
ncbi:MAG: hypothetical protein NT067_04240 [Candidatus Diapherotrites archaeon]|nr:hypothetical protein [Candidatus Diapherotrites archaeon]